MRQLKRTAKLSDRDFIGRQEIYILPERILEYPAKRILRLLPKDTQESIEHKGRWHSYGRRHFYGTSGSLKDVLSFILRWESTAIQMRSMLYNLNKQEKSWNTQT